MKGNNSEIYIYPDEEIITEFEQAVGNLSHLLSFTKQYYLNIQHDEIDLLINMIERAKKSIDGDCFINEQDFIKMHLLITTYDNANTSMSDQLLGAYYLRILAADAKICLQHLKRILKINKNISEDVLEFFSQLCVCLKVMASYEAIQQQEQIVPLPSYTIQN